MRRVLVKKLFQDAELLFADLSKHPARGFVNQVVRMVEHGFRQLQGVVQLSTADESVGGNDRHALFPQVRGFTKPLQHVAIGLVN